MADIYAVPPYCFANMLFQILSLQILSIRLMNLGRLQALG
jgi:hypothetical protein